jgi:hypothetical protein
MPKEAVPTLRIKQTGRGNTGTSRYTFTLGLFRGTDLTKVKLNELRLMKLTIGIPDGSRGARKLLCQTKKALLTACEQSLAGKGGVCS